MAQRWAIDDLFTYKWRELAPADLVPGDNGKRTGDFPAERGSTAEANSYGKDK